MKNHNPFRNFKTSPEVIQLAVMVYVRFPLSLRNVEELLRERGIDICHETVRYWWNRFGPYSPKKYARNETTVSASPPPPSINLFHPLFSSECLFSSGVFYGCTNGALFGAS